MFIVTHTAVCCCSLWKVLYSRRDYTEGCRNVSLIPFFLFPHHPDLETSLQSWTAWSTRFKRRSRWVFFNLLSLFGGRRHQTTPLHHLLCSWPLASTLAGGVNVTSQQWSISIKFNWHQQTVRSVRLDYLLNLIWTGFKSTNIQNIITQHNLLKQETFDWLTYYCLLMSPFLWKIKNDPEFMV